MKNKYIILFSLLGLISCKSNPEKAEKSDARESLIPDSVLKSLTFDTVNMCNLSNSIKFNGMVDFDADKVVNLFPPISGTIQNITAMLGDYVTKGQVLGVIKSPEMANYSASLQNAETNFKLAEKNLQAQKDLFKSGLASQLDVNNAETNYEQAKANKQLAERVLNINGNNKQGEYIIKSPIDGFIVAKNVNNNQTIRTDNSTSLFTISNLQEVWVQANVYEGNIDKVHQGDEVEVTTISYPDKVFKGKIDKLMNVLDPTNKVMKMRVVLNNNNYLLKPQMFATVTVNNTENKKALCVSNKSLVFDHSQYYAIVYQSPTNIKLQPVDVLSMSGSKAYIQSGLQVGQKVVNSQTILIYGALNN